MKKLAALFLMLIATLSYAANSFQLKYTQDGGNITILDNSEDWIQVYESSKMIVYVNQGGFLELNEYRVMHSKISYKKPEEFMNGQSIHHIYSYGMIECKKGHLNLIGDLYTDENFQMIYKKDFQFGEFVADLTQPGTAANAVYGVICADEMI